jgi:hypothetical protein
MYGCLFPAEPTGLEVSSMNADEVRFLAQLAEQEHVREVNNKITLYHNTGDARYFWRAFLLLREAKKPIPEDVLSKIAKYAEGLISAKTPREIAAALELAGDEKSHTGPKHSQAYAKRWRLASEVQLVKRLRPSLPLKSAIQIVARNRGLTVAKVKADYHRVFTEPLGRAAKGKQKTQIQSLANVMKEWRR